MGTWYEKLSSRLPSAPIVRDLVESVERLPGLAAWSPQRGLENHWTEILHWGFVLWMSRSLAGVDAVRKALATEILTAGGPASDSLAELSGASLCVGLGAIAGGRIPRGDGKTADWRMVWPVDASLDLEVTVARRKQRHIEREALATDLAKALFRPDREFDLVINLVNPTVPDDRDAILAMAKTITGDQTMGEAGKWQLRADPITREPTVLLTAGQDPRPAWWPVDHARCFVLHGYVAGPDTRRAPPQVRISFGVPFDSYVNPLMRKADFPQGTEGFPFLVALDVSKLPGAFSELPHAAAGSLPLWKGLSGILLFQDLVGIDRVGWLWRLLTNPYADLRLPESLCSTRADLQQTMETGIRLSNENQGSVGPA